LTRDEISSSLDPSSRAGSSSDVQTQAESIQDPEILLLDVEKHLDKPNSPVLIQTIELSPEKKPPDKIIIPPVKGKEKTLYADIAVSNKNIALDPNEIAEIISHLQKVEISSEISDVVTTDPIKSSEVIPYYRNLKHRVFSVFDTVQDDFLTAQNLNKYLISQLPEAKLTRQTWPKAGYKSPLRITKTGNIMEINKIIHELIFLFKIKEDIDYEASSYKGFSPVVNWLFKIANSCKSDATQKVVHVVLTPKDHVFLTDKLKVESETLAYRLLLQTVNLIALHASLPATTVLTKRIKDLLSNKIEGFAIKKTLTDATNAEPYYIWQTIMTPEERGILTTKVGENFFNTQNKIYRQFRSLNPGNSSHDLNALKRKVDSNLPQGVKATIYGRLKVYREIQESPEVRALLAKRKGTKQLTDAELRRYARDRRMLSLFAEENIVATCYNVVKKPIEIMDLTRNAYLDPLTGRAFYYTADVESTVTYRKLLSHERESCLSIGESALLQSIRSRMIQFIPGISRRE